MKFIEIQDGVSINIDSIESIERIDDFSTEIKTKFNVYKTVFPYKVLLGILEEQEEEINQFEQHFAG